MSYGAHTTKTVASESSQRNLSMYASLGVSTLPIGQKSTYCIRIVCILIGDSSECAWCDINITRLIRYVPPVSHEHQPFRDLINSSKVWRPKKRQVLCSLTNLLLIGRACNSSGSAIMLSCCARVVHVLPLHLGHPPPAPPPHPSPLAPAASCGRWCNRRVFHTLSPFKACLQVPRPKR